LQGLGYAIVLLTFSLQTPLKSLCGRLEGFWRVCVVDVYLFFSFCGTVNVWRGIWMLLNIYFLPGKLSKDANDLKRSQLIDWLA
jgi:hypothetical protein